MSLQWPTKHHCQQWNVGNIAPVKMTMRDLQPIDKWFLEPNSLENLARGIYDILSNKILNGTLSVRNGPGQPEGFQVGFEAAGPGR